jgi:hypothetical protein
MSDDGVRLITGVMASKNGITLFLQGGESEILRNEDYRTAGIIEAVMLRLTKEPSVAVPIELKTYSLAQKLKMATGGQVQIKNDQVIVKQVIEDKVVETKVPLKSLEQVVERVANGRGAAGFMKFMERFNRIDHQFTINHLLKFMERNDLPIADDGSIVVYKYLDASGEDYVDKHTKRVRQKLGSRVWMHLDKTNTDWRQACASGLHVCSVGYGSYGDSVFLAKVDPADVIAVPEDHKMRCVAYHLVAMLPPEIHEHTSARKSLMQSEAGRQTLANVIAGNHVDVLEHVEVGGSTYLNSKTPVTAKPTGKSAAVAGNVDVSTVLKPARVNHKSRSQIEEINRMLGKGDPWKIAKIGDKVRIEGSKQIGQGVYEVIAIDDTKEGARVKVKQMRPDKTSKTVTIKNECVKELINITAQRGELEKAFDEALAVSAKLNEAQAITKAVAKEKKLKTQSAPAALSTPVTLLANEHQRQSHIRNSDYDVKLAKAQRLKNDGWSLREIGSALGMCRKSLGKNLT